MNTSRQPNTVTNSLPKSTEKLSSGYRINRASDDAAGLSISEKMRSQIRGLDRASDNAEDGISLIQTAEGAMNETHSILQRMNWQHRLPMIRIQHQIEQQFRRRWIS